jgi:hypothetical protein
MALLNDVRMIIKPITHQSINIDYYLENLIIHDNSNININTINNYVYSSVNDEETITKIINIIKKYIESYIKNQRNHFRMLNKKNKLFLIDFINYFDKFIKLNMKIYNAFHHIIKNNKNNKKIWNDNEIINFGIQKIVDILYQDIIMKIIMQKNIKDNLDNKKNTELFRFNYYTINFNEYYPVYDLFVELVSHSIISSIEFINLDIDENINKIFHFNKLSQYFLSSLQNYNYIIKNKEMITFKNHIEFYLNSILINNNINNIVSFLTLYKDDLLLLNDHIDILVVMINYKPEKFKDFLLYYSTILNLFEYKDIKNNIIIGIKMNMDNFNSTENCEYLSKIINYNIMNNINPEYNWIYYITGYHMKNKDEFVINICQKLMNRAIYSTFNNKNEFNNYLLFNKAFDTDAHLHYKYKSIFTNIYRSNDLCILKDTLKFLVINPEVWNVNIFGYSSNIINKNIFTAYLCNILYNYNIKTNKHLNYYLHLGHVNITIQDTQLIVLPAQMLCIEQFTGFNKPIKYNDFYENIKINLNNYDNNFISKIIKSLDSILEKDGDNIYMKPFNIINNFKHINLIDIFHNINNTNMIIKKKIQLELAHSRMDIINSVINHFVKLEEYNIDKLYEKVKEHITIFEVDQILYMDSIKNMISKDYIEYNSETKMIKKIL